MENGNHNGYDNLYHFVDMGLFQFDGLIGCLSGNKLLEVINFSYVS